MQPCLAGIYFESSFSDFSQFAIQALRESEKGESESSKEIQKESFLLSKKEQNNFGGEEKTFLPLSL